jgi:hypothetical protein
VSQVHALYANALAEDATVFDYDGVYDQMKASTQKQPVRVTGAVPQHGRCSQAPLRIPPRLRLRLRPSLLWRPSTSASC